MAQETACELTERGETVQRLWDYVSEGESSLRLIPLVVRKIITTEAWKERVHRGRVFQNSSFVEFITAKPLSGCGWPLDKVEALIKDDPEVLTLWREATVGGQGARTDLQHHDNVMKLGQGNSRAYTLTRLKREAPELHEAVCRGELSANAAAIQAGFRKRLSPLEQIARLVPKLSPLERDELVRLLLREAAE